MYLKNKRYSVRTLMRRYNVNCCECNKLHFVNMSVV